MGTTSQLARRAATVVAAIVAVTAPVSAIASTGSPRVGAAPACVAGTGYFATVAGRGVRSVTLVLDGRRIRTLHRPDRAGAFRARVSLTAGRAHRLVLLVRLSGSAGVRTERAQLTLARCDAKIRTPTPTSEAPPAFATG